jgi:hypothetical protein
MQGIDVNGLGGYNFPSVGYTTIKRSETGASRKKAKGGPHQTRWLSRDREREHENIDVVYHDHDEGRDKRV